MCNICVMALSLRGLSYVGLLHALILQFSDQDIYTPYSYVADEGVLQFLLGMLQSLISAVSYFKACGLTKH